MIVGLAVATAVFSTIAAARALFVGRDDVLDRLDRVLARDRRADGSLGSMADRRQRLGFVARLLRSLSRLARPSGEQAESALRSRLAHAGLRSEHAAEIFLGTKLLFAPVIVFVFFQLDGRLWRPLGSPLEWIVAIWLAAVSYLLPNAWLASRAKARQTQIERTLPDALDLLVACVEAGLGVDLALQRVADQLALAAPLLATELDATFLEIQAGMARPDAFRRLAQRTGAEDLKSLAAMLIQTEMFGSSIARALRVQADAMRTKRTQRAEERAGMVAVKLTIPLILCILPALLAIVMGPAVANIAKQFGSR
jgi:tight adherence protein C